MASASDFPVGRRHFRIAMVAACPLPYPRGTPIRIHGLANALAERGHEVHVAAYHLGEPDGGIRYRLHRIPRVATYRKLSPGPNWQKLLVVDPLLALTLRRLLRRFEPQIIHAHHFEGLLVSLLANRRLRLPLVFDAHTLLEAELPYYAMGMTRRAKVRLARWLDQRLPLRCDHIIAVSPTIREKLVHTSRVRPERVSVIPNGVRTELFDSCVGQPAVRESAVRTAIYAGNLAPYQGIDLMLKAFAGLARIRADVRLKIVTEGDFAPYRSLSVQLGIHDRIDVVPATFQQLPAHLASADVALNPRTAADGLPQKLLNYMAAARPIVSFSGSVNMLIHEHTALVVPDWDIPEFTAAIQRLLEDTDLARRLGANARRQASESLSWTAAARCVEDIYARLVPSSR